MTPSEKASLGIALEELARPAAEARRAAQLRQGTTAPVSESFPIGTESYADRTGRVNDLVGEAVGMSVRTYARAKTVGVVGRGKFPSPEQTSRTGSAGARAYQAHEGRTVVCRAWIALGYSTWDQYCADEFGGERIKLPREDRREVMASLRESGLSTRAIGSAVGVNHKTVLNELNRPTGENSPVEQAPDERTITGVNGKTYKASQPNKETNMPTSVAQAKEMAQGGAQ